jgi:hypothetical protein
MVTIDKPVVQEAAHLARRPSVKRKAARLLEPQESRSYKWSRSVKEIILQELEI